MFWFPRFLQSPKKRDVSVSASGFEPEEHPTPFLGKVLLVMMTIVLFFFGWRGLDDLGEIPARPDRLSSCFVAVEEPAFTRGDLRFVASLDPKRPETFPSYIFDDFRGCTFSSFEREAGVPDAFRAAADAQQRVAAQQTKLNQSETQIRQYERQYNISLLERISDEEALRAVPEQLRATIRSLDGQRAQAKEDLQRAEAEYSEELPPLTAAYRVAGDAYERAWAGYKFWVFLLELLFTVPFFGVALRFYRRLHGRASPHTVIAIPIVAVAALLLSRVFLVYFWSLFLADLLLFLFSVLERLAIFRTLLYYIGMLIAVAIFGGSVYRLQTAVFAPERVRLRRLRAKKCPACEFPLELAESFCPGCGKQIRAACPQCGKLRYVGMGHCPSCGKA
ncbi:MAG: hypothetical protein A2991_04230 [Candidatus Terrybacteria bacterium RIFCSPLOWO2_01_FULL_58_14]|uniref:DZANK-type domain-containing protein n=1 Tax=Candidatus Terrybacteria bacterium RIFCSPLOWO2_01_FULL_58_14 TaxID=1802369 RepID=A0A1G2PW26_9BACT|nr:MAG: hypothetical protein A2991_04230 [Candidatus Terrybacteria bacterium RIFCSPLOWO2_01_FULL_58_14]